MTSLPTRSVSYYTWDVPNSKSRELKVIIGDGNNNKNNSKGYYYKLDSIDYFDPIQVTKVPVFLPMFRFSHLILMFLFLFQSLL